ncbi:MAG TPA: metallophosphoesterase, partial [Rubrivivax sp.]|nr:metallophosphoesterase [Rubrivivax sp.]
PSPPASSPAAPVAPAEPELGAFAGSVVLGCPTDRSIRANVYAPAQAGQVWLMVGSQSGVYERQTDSTPLAAGQPVEIGIEGLQPDTAYVYRLQFRSADGVGSGATPEYRFHTARAPGSSFSFAIQGDSHPERVNSQFDEQLYQRTLLLAADAQPDFYVAMGDDFSVDTLDPATLNASQVVQRYALQRPYLGLIGRTAPLFLVNGNHEQAARYLLDGMPDNLAVWAQNARNSYYAEPAPDSFYSGNPERVPHIGLLRNYYAWTWGDALFVVIDPYWASPVAVDNTFGRSTKTPASGWDVTHGDAQYQWLKRTLEGSRARYKFVFAHHVMGTGRGGIELAGRWEWGGLNAKGVNEFAAQRPGWALPIHALMVANKVTIFFQGHDHIWVRQQLDGVTYQTLSQPADPNYALNYESAYLSGQKWPSTGYTHVSVGPGGVTVSYIRTWLPKDEGPGKTSGDIAYSYTLS